MSVSSLSNAVVTVLELIEGPVSSTLGSKKTWSAVQLNGVDKTIKANFEKISFDKRMHWKALDVNCSHVFFFDVDPEVIELKNAFLFEGRRYEIIDVDNFQNMNRQWEITTQQSRHAP